VKFEDAVEFANSYINRTEFKPTYEEIMRHINCLMNDEPLPPYSGEKIKDDFRKLYADFFNHSTEFEYIRFIEAVSEIVFNWNDNVLHDPDINVYANSLKKLVAISMCTKNAILAMKESIEKFRRLKGWAPTTTDISLAYLDTLLKDK